ncbi:hypothetical protein GF323_05100 [Candidatus Woesearchaeota archaeon]|nr:hypothetical protein [Candidatus Woesearchaeota archaeon]
MIELVYSPKWFYGKDIIIDIVSIFVLSLIAFFSLKYYSLYRKKRNYLTLGISFIIIAASFLFKILTNFTLYFKVFETRQLGFVTLTYQTLRSTNTLFFIGFLLYRILTLLGLYLLYNIYQKDSRSTIFLVIYLLLISSYFSQSEYFIFHLTALILLILITLYYIRNYRKNKNKTSRLLMSSFAIIAASQIFFIFVRANLILYVVAEIIQLIGYVALLITFIMVLKHAKKKK